MSGCELRLFGPPRVRLDDVHLRFDTRKAPALLAYLAVTGHAHGRDALTALLWPDLPHANARAALRRTLSVASAVGPALVVQGDAISLTPAFCDVVEFGRLVDAGTVAAASSAVALADGDFLEGFTLRDSPNFEEWRFDTQRALQDRLSAALRRLSAHAARSGDVEAAMDFARRRVRIDPLSEQAHADLMLVTAWSGDRSTALLAYRELVRRLDRTLGVSPTPSTQALYHAIRTGSVPPPPASRGADHPRPEVARQVVASAAVIGAPADMELLRLVSGRDEAEITAAVNEGVLVGTGSPRRYEPADPRATAEALAGLSLARRRLLHSRTAEALARRAGSGNDERTARIVGEHFADAGRDAEAGDWFLVAAAVAAERGDDDAAREALRSAVAVGCDTAEVQLSLASALLRLGLFAEALVALGRATELSRDGEPELAAARDALAEAEDAGDLAGIVVRSSHLADLLHAAGREEEARTAQRHWAQAIAELEHATPSPHPWTISEW